ncbi:7-cyano-7-deazaguanine synthase [Estrella lausannensis]|uniref:site-specific DNA-methyltransferase (cytosine-N(4)-specific) n=1 Tax=Estrella lausannensis TaxID=483423 RepID=A0A0H5DRC2_9BACT|nr:7-cyano-7-deazaguanine synthase [Estrella lausannensis]CRX38219.1 7-cyano-7-deazaguanine synthase [Estrella lausannensis]
MNITFPSANRSTIANLDNSRAIRMYENYATLPEAMEVPPGQLEYAKALCQHHGLPTENIIEGREMDATPRVVPLIKNRVIIPFSGGTDSTAALIWAKRQGMHIYPLHVYMLNPASGAREMTAVENICNALGLRDRLIVVKHPVNCRKIKGYREKIKNLQENPAKNQYIWLISLPYMQKHECGTILFAADKSPQAIHFSDTITAFNLFKQYAEKLIGPHNLCIPFDTKKQYVAELLSSEQAALSKLVSSCFASMQHFKHWQNTNRKKGEDTPDNECGSCQKCRTLKEIRAELLAPGPQKKQENSNPREVPPTVPYEKQNQINSHPREIPPTVAFEKQNQENTYPREIPPPVLQKRFVSTIGKSSLPAGAVPIFQNLLPPLRIYPYPTMMEICSPPLPARVRERDFAEEERASPLKRQKFDFSAAMHSECIEPRKFSAPIPRISSNALENQLPLRGFASLNLPQTQPLMGGMGPWRGLNPTALAGINPPPKTREVAQVFNSVEEKIEAMVKGFTFPKTKGDGVYSLDFDALKSWMQKKLNETLDVTQEEKEAFYERIGELLSDEITKHQYKLPHLHNGQCRSNPVITADVAAESFKLLLNLGNYDFTRTYTGMQAGLKMSAFYMNEERIKASTGIDKSPSKKWEDEKLRWKKITKIFKYHAQGKAPYLCLGLPLITNDFLMNAPGQFRPAAVFDVLNYLKQSNVAGNITRILDLCTGWGDRLVGAMAAAKQFKVVRYIGTDPNKDLTPRYKNIFDACLKVLDREMGEPYQFTCKLYDKPMEDLSEEELIVDGVPSDLMITSPPFFDYEKYKDHGNTQSTARYPEIDEWVNNFLYKLVDQAKKGVRNQGIVAIQFSTTKIGDKKICDLLKANMQSKLKHITDLSYVSKAIRGKRHGYEGEKFYIYQKVEASDNDEMDVDVG